MNVEVQVALDRFRLIGKRFGKWIVIEKDMTPRAPKAGSYYFCKCDCGHKSNVWGHALRTAKSTRCKNCANRAWHIARRTI